MEKGVERMKIIKGDLIMNVDMTFDEDVYVDTSDRLIWKGGIWKDGRRD